VDRGWSSSARCCIVDASVVAIVAGCCADDHEFIARATPASPPFRSVAGYFDPPGHSLFPKTVMDDSTPVVVRVNFRVSVNWVGYGKVKLKCAKSHGSAGEVLIFLPH